MAEYVIKISGSTARVLEIMAEDTRRAGNKGIEKAFVEKPVESIVAATLLGGAGICVLGAMAGKTTLSKSDAEELKQAVLDCKDNDYGIHDVTMYLVN